MKASWDIFCSVVDNYGDIGVTWRLARQLVAEHDLEVRLWVDDIASLQRIWPDTLTAEQQILAGVEVRVWHTAFDQSVQPAEIVIEAFACDIPPAYLGAMAAGKAKGQPPLWINLEYLSAEAYVERCHRLASPVMSGPLAGRTQWFFYPGFTPRTGGLLREPGLLAEFIAGWRAENPAGG